MNMNRFAFVVVMASVGAACEVYVGSKTPQNATGAQAPDAATAAGTVAASPAASPAPPPRKPTTLHFGQGGAPNPAPPAAPSGGAAPAPGPVTDGRSCLDTGATSVGDCAAMQAPDPSCTPSAAAQQKCNAYKAYFDAKVAAAAISCLAGLTGKPACDPLQTSNCAKSALAQACADPSVAQLCQIAASSCKTTSADCTSMLSGLNPQGQQAVAMCVAQGCQAGLYACIDGLTAAAPQTSTKAMH
jgi:hypothetical protein